jgi:hypothetical protein
MIMEAWKKKAIEVSGYRIGDAGDFLELTDEERQLVEIRVALARAVRRRREASKMTQEQLAKRIGSNQARVAKIEAAARGVSLDQMFKSLIATGGGLKDLVAMVQPRKARIGTRKREAAPKVSVD